MTGHLHTHIAHIVWEWGWFCHLWPVTLYLWNVPILDFLSLPQLSQYFLVPFPNLFETLICLHKSQYEWIYLNKKCWHLPLVILSLYRLTWLSKTAQDTMLNHFLQCRNYFGNAVVSRKSSGLKKGSFDKTVHCGREWVCAWRSGREWLEEEAVGFCQCTHGVWASGKHHGDSTIHVLREWV